MHAKYLLIFLHLTCVASWLGCILVEAIYEHTIEPTTKMRQFVARLHWATDKYIEIPSFVGVLVTGVLLVPSSSMDLLVKTKIGFGLVAILFNVACVVLVVKRLTAIRQEDSVRYERLDRLQHKWGAVVLLGVIAALSIGGYRFANGLFL